MKRDVLISVAILSAASAELLAGKLPPEFTYIIYVKGKDAGKSTTKVIKTADTYIFESRTEVATDQLSLNLNTRTEVDKKTFLPIRFTYDGSNQQQIVEGETTIEGNEATCVVRVDGEQFTSSRMSKHPLLLLEDFVMAHEVVIARAFWESGEDPAQFGLLFPSLSNLTSVQISKSSELAFESENKETYCVKLIVSLTGGAPFASYYDPERGLPVYLAFPSASTEVFLDEFFDGQPVSRYRE